MPRIDVEHIANLAPAIKAETKDPGRDLAHSRVLVEMANEEPPEDRPVVGRGALSARRIDLGLAGGMAAATVGFIVGYLVIRIGADHPRWHNADGSVGFVFADDASIQTWTLLIAGEVALWTVLFGPLVGWYRQVRPPPGDRAYFKTEVGAVVGLFLLLTLVPQMLAPNAAMPIHHYYGRVRALSGVACVVIGPGLAGFVAIHRRSKAVARGRVDGVGIEVLRVLARRMLFAIGSIVSGALLATGFASRIIHARDPTDTTLTHDLVLLYGLLFSGLLALVFVPTYVAVEAASRCPIGRDSAQVAGSSDIETSGPLEMSAFRVLTEYVFVLSPLLSAVVAGFLGG